MIRSREKKKVDLGVQSYLSTGRGRREWRRRRRRRWIAAAARKCSLRRETRRLDGRGGALGKNDAWGKLIGQRSGLDMGVAVCVVVVVVDVRNSWWMLVVVVVVEKVVKDKKAGRAGRGTCVGDVQGLARPEIAIR
jgi:hypothetical protein